MKLPVHKRIRVIDAWQHEEFGLDNIPLLSKFEEKDFQGYPFCYLDGIIVEPAQFEILEAFLQGYLKEDFMITIEKNHD